MIDAIPGTWVVPVTEENITHLVLGGAGFVGVPFCRFLREQGIRVVNLDIKNGGGADLRTRPLPVADYVWWLAWDVGGAKWLYDKNNQVSQYLWNSELMENVFEQLARLDSGWTVPFTFVSSQMATTCDMVYGAQKRLGELVAQEMGGSVVRLWNVYGAQEDVGQRSHVIGDIVAQAHSGRIDLLTTGLESRRFVHIDDVCRGLWEARHPCEISELYGNLSTILEAATMVADMTKASLHPGSAIATRDDHWAPVGPKLEGWWPQVSLEQGLRRMIDGDA